MAQRMETESRTATTYKRSTIHESALSQVNLYPPCWDCGCSDATPQLNFKVCLEDNLHYCYYAGP